MYFITGNKNKFEEMKSLLPDIEQFDIDLPEIQEVDARKVIEAKLKAADAHGRGEYIVEDTSLYLDALEHKLPGPLIKWFEKTMGVERIAVLAEKMGMNGATAKTVIGYASASGALHFFEGELRGTIVPPTGDKDFGWGPIFKPEGYGKTFGEMTREEKYAISMRTQAIQKLKEFLEPISKIHSG